jgi:competence protein CoiA
MMFANTLDGDRVLPKPGVAGQCPACGSACVPKCGEIVIWHWAHVARGDCDPWSEPETYWHALWQESVPKDRQEIVIGNHRADVVTADGFIVELQHSGISPAEIREREDFYGQMIWLFDATACQISVRPKDGYVTFRWMHPRKSLATCRKPVWLDIGGNKVLQVQKIYTAAPCGGWGYIVTTDSVRSWMLNGTQLEEHLSA